jgi:hypothetical protein
MRSLILKDFVGFIYSSTKGARGAFYTSLRAGREDEALLDEDLALS